eukprot:2254800-Ditylum_brightwellii.AAC.1
MKRELNTITMKKAENPAHLFEKISGLENRYNTSLFYISLDDQIATVLDKAPVEYSTVLTCEQRTKVSAMTMLDLEEAMSQLYRSMYSKDGNNDEGKEIRLSTTDNSVRFRCGKKGHRSFQCK